MIIRKSVVVAIVMSMVLTVGIAGASEIKGFTFYDANKNGKMDPGEPGLSGFTIKLLYRGAIINKTTTDSNGFYDFTNLARGNYFISEQPPLNSGWRPLTLQGFFVSLGPNQTKIQNFSNVISPSHLIVSGFKINDVNGNGIWDPGEQGIQGWNITLRDNPTNTILGSILTSSTGFYVFSVKHGIYNVSEEDRAGWTHTNATFKVITVNAAIINLNFTNTRDIKFNISGFKINDSNGDGVWNPGEEGLHGWNITLENATAQMNTLTDANGFFNFSNLIPGNYTLREEDRAGWVHTNMSSKPITIVNEDLFKLNFTNKLLTLNISGFKINDTDRDGFWDPGEKGIQGWNITLLNGTTNAFIESTLTDASGFYQFNDLLPGEYNVTEEIRNEWKPTNATYRVIALVDKDVTDLNFTNDLLMISGYKINDTNGNGLWDPGEEGIAGWNITLLDGSTNAFIASTQTDASGYYEFRELFLGGYNVTEETKAGWIPTNDTFKNVNLVNGDITNLNFTNNLVSICMLKVGPKNSVYGCKFNDENGNRIRDSGEEFLANWTIRLSGFDSSTRHAILEYAITDSSGFYVFTNLTPGFYTVCEGSQPNWKPTTLVCVGAQIKDNSSKAVNFGNRLSPSHVPISVSNVSTIFGYKFNDTNENKIFDDNESGLGGWTIRLTGFDTNSRNVVNLATTTNSTGYFEFRNISSGSYTLSEMLRPGWMPTTSPFNRVNVPLISTTIRRDFGNRRI